MIFGKPTLHDVLNFVQEEGYPACGKTPMHISVGGPDEIVPTCGHVIDAKDWIGSRYADRDLDASKQECD